MVDNLKSKARMGGQTVFQKSNTFVHRVAKQALFEKKKVCQRNAKKEENVNLCTTVTAFDLKVSTPAVVTTSVNLIKIRS